MSIRNPALGAGALVLALALAVAVPPSSGAADSRPLPLAPTSAGAGWSTIDPAGDGFDANPAIYLPLSDDSIYVAGSFTLAGGRAADWVAVWKDDTWSPLGSANAVSYIVNELALGPDDSLYITGYFSVPGSRIARWDGSAWSGLGSGLNGAGFALAETADDSLYVGGEFTSAGGVSASGIARWDGTSWSGVGGGVAGGAPNVRDIAVTGDDSLYISGDFTTAGGKVMNNVALWKDDTWTSLGSGLDGRAVALALTDDDTLYAAGEFTTAGGAIANGIARWDGSQWSPLGFGVSTSTFAYRDLYGLAYDDTHELLYVSGIFDFGCAEATCSSSDPVRIPMSNIGAWDVVAQAWIPLVSNGVNGTSFYANSVTLSPDATKLYVGGTFASRGGVTMVGPAVWRWPAPVITEVLPGSGTAGTATPIAVTGTSLAAVTEVTVDGVSVPFTREPISGEIQLTVPAGSGDRLIRVSAIGGTSAPFTFTQSGAPPAPVPAGAPRDVVASAGAGSATVSWQPPASSGSFPVTTYQVVASPGDRACLTQTLTCTVTGLVNGREYSVRVRALNGAGWGAWSDAVAVTPRAGSVAITGRRGVGARIDRVAVRGVVSGIEADTVTISVRVGDRPWRQVVRPVAEDGTFRWKRVTRLRVIAFAEADGVRSARVRIPRAG